MTYYQKITKSNLNTFSNQFSNNEITIIKYKNKLVIEILLTAKEFLFYRIGQDSIEISNDLRILYREGDSLNLRGVYNILQFSTTIPPVSLFKDISVFLFGFRYTLNIADFNFTKEPLWSWSEIDSSDYLLGKDQQKKLLVKKVDDVILKNTTEKQPLLLYSGGLDSNLLAQRISKLNFSNPILVHYAFDQHHHYTLKAKSIAEKLGLAIRIVCKGEFDEFDLFNKFGQYYKSPVFDPSNMMIYSLFNYISTEFDPDEYTVLNGDGADSILFGYDKINQIKFMDSMPRYLKYAISFFYKHRKMYLYPSLSENYLKFFKQSSDYGVHAIRLSQNPLLNIAYFADNDMVKESEKDLNDMINQTYIGEVQYAHDILLGLYDVSKITTNSILNIFSNSGFTVNSAFEDMDFVDYAIQHMSFWDHNRVSKSIFKDILSEDLPYRLSHIGKTYFSLQFTNYFGEKRFLSLFEEVIESQHQISSILNYKILEEFYLRCKKRKKLPTLNYVFIWSLVLLHQWLKNLSYESEKLKGDLNFYL